MSYSSAKISIYFIPLNVHSRITERLGVFDNGIRKSVNPMNEEEGKADCGTIVAVPEQKHRTVAMHGGQRRPDDCQFFKLG